MVQGEDGPVRGRGFQLAGKPVELGLAQFAVVEAGNRRVQGDDAQSVDEVAVVHGRVTAGLVQQALPEVGAVVVVAHGPDDFRTQGLAGGVHDGAQLLVCAGFALVGQVAGENDSLRPGPGRPDFVKELNEAGFAVNDAVEGIRTSQQVGIAQVE